MLKKAGIVVAATTAAMLAVSPLAFASSDDDDDDSTPGVLSGNAVQVSVLDNALCKVNALNNVIGIGQSNKNNQKGDCKVTHKSHNE